MIVIVSADPTVRERFKQDLRVDLGGAFQEVGSVEEAREAIAKAALGPLVLICDHSAQVDAFALFTPELERQYAYAVRVMLAAQADLALAMRAVNEAGVTKFFLRPWDRFDLRIGMLRALELAGQKYAGMMFGR